MLVNDTDETLVNHESYCRSRWRLALSVLCAAAAIVVLVVGSLNVHSVAQRAAEESWIRQHGERFTGIVVDEGFTRPDGSMTNYWVQSRQGGREYYIDAQWSPTKIRSKGQSIDVAVDPRDLSVPSLTVDALDHRWWGTYATALLPFLGAVLLGTTMFWLRRPQLR